MTEGLKKTNKNPHTIILEGFAEIEKLKSVQVSYIKKKLRYQELLDNDENVTEIETKYFREIIDMMNTMWATLPLMIENYQASLSVIDTNKEDVTKIVEDINRISKEHTAAEKKLLEIEDRIFTRGNESKSLSGIIKLKIDMMNHIYINEAEKPQEDDYLKMTREMRKEIIEVITKNISNKRIPYESALLKYSHIPMKYVDALYLTLYNQLIEKQQENRAIEKQEVVIRG